MRLASRLFPIALLGVLATPALAVVTPMGDLHCNKSNGIPAMNGQQVTVQGTVTCPDNIFSHTNIDVHLQDATGAIVVFIGGGVGTFSFALNDSVEVTGWVKHFNGLTEIDSTGFVTVTHLGTASVQPEPLVLTCLQVANSYQGDNCDPNESKLIRINGVHITGGVWPSSPSGANTTLTIADASGSTTVFIDLDSPVNGSPDPGGRFDIIGVMRQFDSSNPRTSGYQLVPRFVSDVIPECPGPLFASSPEPTALDSMSASITWLTDSPGTSFVNYGTTTTYTDRVGNATPTTTHTVSLTGLQPRTLYHFQAESGDGNGTCFSNDRALVTFPSPGTPGGMAVYFTQSLDHSVANGGPLAQGDEDMIAPMLQLIDSAEVSIDCAFYYFNLVPIADGLIAAKNRGVQVRLIIDEGASPTQANRLAAAGIPYIDSRYGPQNHGQTAGFGIMHSKYMVLDAKSPSKDDDYVWTGSFNITNESQEEANNSIAIHDYGLAAAYTLDFEQMWGSSTATPDSTKSKMGSLKDDIIPHRFMIGGIRVEAYMSPSDQPETRMIQYIQQAQYSQLFCIFDFTSDPLSHAMKMHRDSIPGFIVSGVFEGSQVGSFSEWCRLNGEPSCSDYWIPRGDVIRDTSTAYSLVHHKYQILDVAHPGATVWTGSHNWSNAAKTVNDENTVVIHDPTIAGLYYQDFHARYAHSGGRLLEVPAGAANPALRLSPCRPNPTQGTTTFDYSLRDNAAKANLSIYDLSGRRVRTLVNGPIAAGPHQVFWDGRSEAGRLAATGVYFYRLKVGTESITRRLVLSR